MTLFIQAAKIANPTSINNHSEGARCNYARMYFEIQIETLIKTCQSVAKPKCRRLNLNSARSADFFFFGSSCSHVFQRCEICRCHFSWTTSCIITKLVTHHLSASRSFENNNPERPSLVGRARHAEGGRRDPRLTPAAALHLNHKLSRVGNCV